MAKIVLPPITNAQSLSLINSNFQSIAEDLNDKVLYRDNPFGEPNQLQDTLDVNGNDLINVNEINVNTLKIDGIEVVAEEVVVNGGLLKNNNLSDVQSATASRINLGLGNIDNTSDLNKPISTATQAALDAQTAATALKANITSPTFLGDPKAPTPATSDADTSLATTLYVVNKLAAPTAIGSVTPSTGAFTTLSASSNNPSFNYLLSATGSVARTFISKFGETVSVLDFGADPTGVANSAPAFQAAVTYVLSLTNGGSVYIPRGLFKINTTINVPNTAGVSIRIHGDGSATRLVWGGAASSNMFFMGSNTPTFGSFYTLDNFSFNGSGAAGTTAIYFKNINSGILYNINVLGNHNALLLEASFNTRVIGCDFNSQTQYGISTNVTGTNSLLVDKCVITSASVSAINLAVGGNNIVIRDTDFEANAVTLSMSGGYTSVLFEGNYAENNTNSYFSFANNNFAIDIRQNWFGANGVSTPISNVFGGSFVNNTLFNCAFTFATQQDVDSGGNVLLGTATLGSTLFTTSIVFLNNWVASTRALGYKKLTNGVVEIRGNVAAGVGSLGNTLFTLPVGYRPSLQKLFITFNQTNASLTAVTVDTNGNVVPASAGGAVGNVISLDGIMFTAAN